MPDPRNIAEWVGIVGAILLLCVNLAIVCWPLIRKRFKRRYAWFWIAAGIATVYGGTKPPTPPGPSVEGIALKIDRVWSNKVRCSWTIQDEPELTGKRVRILVTNAKMNGWQEVFEGDAETDTSCTFAGCWITEDTQVQVQVENAVVMAQINLEMD